MGSQCPFPKCTSHKSIGPAVASFPCTETLCRTETLCQPSLGQSIPCPWRARGEHPCPWQARGLSPRKFVSIFLKALRCVGKTFANVWWLHATQTLQKKSLTPAVAWLTLRGGHMPRKHFIKT